MTKNFYGRERVERLEESLRIDPALYPQYHIKKGLRNQNGTGVKVGLTQISDVVGYQMEEGEKKPIQGELYYRGIPLTDLVHGVQAEDRLGYEEVAYLLLFGQLPDKGQLKEFRELLAQEASLPDQFKEDVFFHIPGHEIMNKLQQVVLALYFYDPAPDDTSLLNSLRQSISLLAKMPTLIAYAYRTNLHYFEEQSLIIHSPQPGYHIAENVLHMIRADSQFEGWEAELLDLCLMVQADHGGGNNSTFTTHVVSSTGTDTYSALSAAIGSLKGPRHGGANARVMAMMDDIHLHCDWQDKNSLRDYLRLIFQGEAFDRSGLIYGVGHAVYTLSDPRAELLKEKIRLCHKPWVDEEMELRENICSIAGDFLREKMGEDFVSCPNVDMYTGLAFRILNIPEELDTPLFALARTAGWCAHRLEQLQDTKIMRPAYVYIGGRQDYRPLEER